MKLIEHRWVHTLWCDDIRHEIGNKPSFMGVYNLDLVMPTLPAILPRLSAFITVGTPANQPFKKLQIRVEKNDAEQAIASIEVPADQLTEMAAELSNRPTDPTDLENTEPRGIAMSFIIQLGSMPITETTKSFKVWVDTEADTLESFKLRVSAPAMHPIYQQIPNAHQPI